MVENEQVDKDVPIDALVNVHADLSINRYKLEEEAARQSTLYLYYSDRLVEAKADEDTADDELDKVLGRVELNLRDNPPEGLKVTDSTIKALVAKNEEVDQAKAKLRAAKKIRYRLDGIIAGLGHKKSGIDNLVVLWTKGYYMSDGPNRRTGNDEASDAVRGNLNRGVER